MINKRFHILSISLGLLIASCGVPVEDSGAECGCTFRVDSLEPAGGASAANSTDIDMVVDSCPTTPESFEEFTKVSATATFSNSAIGEGDEPQDIQLESYTVKYIPLDGGAELTTQDFGDEGFLQTIVVPGGGNSTVSVEMVPLSTKNEFMKFFSSVSDSTTIFPVFHYNAHYEFKGRTAFDVVVKADADVTLTFTNFNMCP